MCERYWPEQQGTSVTYGQLVVTAVSVDECADYKVTRLRLRKKVGSVQNV